MYSVLIVDDEPNARAYIRRLLKSDDQVTQIDECKNGKEAIAFVKQKTPNIIFLDIQMPGATGLEVVPFVDKESVVIFTTAYDQYAIKAFDFAALDYLLKPFDEERFQRAIGRAKEHIEKQRQHKLSQKMLSVINEFNQDLSPHLSYIEIKKKGMIQKIDVRDIEYIEANSVYAEIHTDRGKELYRNSLNELEKKLPTTFIRVHRAFILNTAHIKNQRHNNDNTFEFEMIDGARINSSRSYKSSIVEHFS